MERQERKGWRCERVEGKARMITVRIAMNFEEVTGSGFSSLGFFGADRGREGGVARLA